MNQILAVTDKTLIDIIIGHKFDLQEREEPTEMQKLATEISKCVNFDTTHVVFKHYANILRKISEDLDLFGNDDLSSLLTFIEYSGIINDQICFHYLRLLNENIDISRKALILKIAFVLDKNQI